jgi:hypothetical protein
MNETEKQKIEDTAKKIIDRFFALGATVEKGDYDFTIRFLWYAFGLGYNRIVRIVKKQHYKIDVLAELKNLLATKRAEIEKLKQTPQIDEGWNAALDEVLKILEE